MINICACFGPQNGDPECPCKMRSMGLKPNMKEATWTQEQIDAINKWVSENKPKIKEPKLAEENE